MNLVKSQNKNDCGVCALAMLTEQPYDAVWKAILYGRVARRLKGNQQTSGYPTSGKDLIAAAGRLGWGPPESRCKPAPAYNLAAWNDLAGRLSKGQRMIVRVQYQNVRASHWVAFDGSLVFDSAWDCPVTAGRTYPLVPLSYIVLEPGLGPDL